jgi:SAM-dependent methyltransferase
MDQRSAVALLSGAVARGTGTWADLGAGSGTFTRALAALLGRDGTVYAVERDLSSVKALHAVRRGDDDAAVIPVHADFLQPLDLPPLDGLLLANALHFIPGAEQQRVLATLIRPLRPGGRLVMVEYDGRGPNRWVPHPVSIARLHELAAALHLGAVQVVGRRPSAYSGTMYAGYADV